MKHSRKIAFILTALASGAVVAQSGTTSRSPDLVITPSPATSPYLSGVEMRPQEKDGVAYLCGGIGSEEQARMKSAASKYDAMLTFAAANGAYIANVNVDIADNKGQSVFSTTCDAPILLVDMPKGGNYKITAEAEGRTLTRTARLNEKGSVKRVTMTWPTDVVDMGLTPNMDTGTGGSGMRSSGAGGSDMGGAGGGTGSSPEGRGSSGMR